MLIQCSQQHMSLRECDRCHYIKPDGTRCRLSTCTTGRYCWIHTRKRYMLRVKPSTIPNAGKGLFAATADFTAGQNIVPYTGDVLTRAQLHARYPNNDGQYVLQAAGDRFIDARSTQSSVGRYANTCRGTNKPCNARFTNGRDPSIRATRYIPDGSEILVPYGSAFRAPAAASSSGSSSAAASAQRRAVPVYNANQQRRLFILCGGMNFTTPAGAVPAHSDDVRCRMLAHLYNARVKSIGSNANNSATHTASDLRQLANRRSLARADTEACNVFILDFYFLKRIYFTAGHGYGNTWFDADGQVAYLLSHRCRAVILPYDTWGMMWAQYTDHEDEMAAAGITVERTNSTDINPLAVATLRAERDTNWLQLKPNDEVYNRTYAQGSIYLSKAYKFIVAYKAAGTMQWLRAGMR